MNIHAPQTHSFQRQRRGFSLVELAVALGIMAFALTAILGLVPIGLSTLQKSINESAQTNIVQSLLNDAYSSDLTALTASTHFFNEAGQVLHDAEESDWDSERIDLIYRVKLALRPLQLEDNSGLINLSGQTLLIGIESRTNAPSDRNWSLNNLGTLPPEIDLHTAVLVQQ